MAYDLEEQEQIATLKAWWKQYGNLVTIVATAALLTIAAFQGWRYYRHSQSVAAVTLYEQVERAERAADHKKVRDIAAQIVGKYGSTPYAAMAALASAKAAFTAGDLAAAKEQLGWTMERAREEEIKDLARLRLAGVLLDEKKYDEALKLLETKPVESMTGLYADLRGDVLAAQGKNAEARSAYQLALDKSDSGSTYRAVVQLKLDALGEKP
ncbi:MAG TPA: tetratricopeptide repeat protein [Burkholderiales bacterium]|nr:tetratricopeptide repeat protein [Burkholderiales bacterium]